MNIEDFSLSNLQYLFTVLFTVKHLDALRAPFLILEKSGLIVREGPSEDAVKQVCCQLDKNVGGDSFNKFCSLKEKQSDGFHNSCHLDFGESCKVVAHMADLWYILKELNFRRLLKGHHQAYWPTN